MAKKKASEDEQFKKLLRETRVMPSNDMSVCTVYGDKGDIDNTFIYKEHYKIDLDRAIEIVNYIVDSGLFPEEVQQALCLGIRSMAYCKLAFK